MNLKNGKNTSIQNSKTNKTGLGEKINHLAKKNSDKYKHRSNNNKIKNNDFPTSSIKNEYKNEVIYNNIPYGLEDFTKNKLSASVNYNFIYDDKNLININSRETEIKTKKKKGLKRSSNFKYTIILY